MQSTQLLKKTIILSFLMIFTFASWFSNSIYPNQYLHNIFYTAIAMTIIYTMFVIIFEEAIAHRIKQVKIRYTFRKAFSIIYLLIFLAVLIKIWVSDTSALLVSFGIIGAGIAIALQDIFKNFVGGLMIFTTGVYRVGDRIEVSGRFGDVIDIGIFYTSLLEIQGWVEGDQSSGRIIMLPNGLMLSNAVNNYTKDHEFIWDEISLPITYDSDWKLAMKKITKIVTEETKTVAKRAERDLKKLEGKYYLSGKVTDPSVYITLTDNWINLNIRYVTDTRGRRRLHNELSQKILQMIEKTKSITIANETTDVTLRKPKRR